MDLSATALLRELNSAQQEVVVWCDGPMLVLAGAGSGKTRAVTYKVAWLLAQEKYMPDQILSVTFTNKAAGEMKNRLTNVIGPAAAAVEAGTFHSVCARLLRQNAEAIGFKSSFIIYDVDDATVLMKQVTKDLGYDTKDEFPPRLLGSTLDRLVNRGEALEEWAVATKLLSQLEWRRKAAEILKAYDARKKALNAMDFTDLLTKAQGLLESNKQVRDYYRKRFQYVLVDEMQDTNLVQMSLLRLLVGDHNRICAVGDDDQSIYGWRGARIENMLNFEDEFPNTRIVRLEQNYRSTKTILSAAYSLIRRNSKRREKKLWTENSEGDSVVLVESDSDLDESERVLRQIREHLKKGVALRDMAILYRTNAQSRPFEEVFSREKLAHVVVGGLRFYERAEVKDLLAYLRVLANPSDDIALMRIINNPPRGIGESALDKLRLSGQITDFNTPLFTKAQELADGKERWVKAVKAFVELIESLRQRVGGLSLSDLAKAVLTESGYLERLETLNDIERESRGQNLNQLVGALAEYQERKPEGTLQDYLEEVSLITDIDLWNSESDRIPLMTVHAAKGLEFDIVFIVGMDNNLFPMMGRVDPSDIEEERRLFYVAMTRARNRVYLYHAATRRRYGQLIESSESPFLAEIGSEYVEHRASPRRRSFSDVYNDWGGRRAVSESSWSSRRNDFSSGSKPEAVIQHSGSQSEQTSRNWTGRSVNHSTFGSGKVLAFMPNGTDPILLVGFESGLKQVRTSEITMVVGEVEHPR